MTAPNALVFVIDDDASVRKGVSRLLRSAGYKSEAFESASDFLEREQHAGPTCVIVDVRMPGLNGIDLQETLIQRRREEQLIFITGHGDISMCAQAMKAGAADFLPKPFRDDELLQCVGRALIRSAEQRRRSTERNEVRRLLDLLTPREFQVMQLVFAGMLNKQVAGELGTAEKTVKSIVIGLCRSCVSRPLRNLCVWLKRRASLLRCDMRPRSHIRSANGQCSLGPLCLT